jgi:hypothetical protein
MVNKHFEDEITVHTSPSGTQHVNLLELLLGKEERFKIIEQVRAEIKEEQRTAEQNGEVVRQEEKKAVPIQPS